MENIRIQRVVSCRALIYGDVVGVLSAPLFVQLGVLFGCQLVAKVARCIPLQ
jgi:hypothetical protein